MEHLKGSNGLVHGNHVAGIVHSQELQVVNGLQSTSSLAVHVPVDVVGSLEVGLAVPLDSVGPGLATSPVADEVLVSGVDEHIKSTSEDVSDLGREAEHPVAEHGSVDEHVALLPLPALNAEDLLDGRVGHHVVSGGEVVAHRRNVTLLSDVIDVELGLARVSKDDAHEDVADIHSLHPAVAVVNHVVTDIESSLKDNVLSLLDEMVLVGEVIVSGVLGVGVDEAVSDSHSLEVDLQVLGVLEHEVVGDSRDVVTGVTLSGDVEVLALHFGVSFEEAHHHLCHVLGDLVFVGAHVEDCGAGETGSNGLVNVDNVGVVVPGVGVRLESLTIVLELVGTVLVEESNLRGAAGSTSKPEYEGVGLGSISGVEGPVEDIVLAAVSVVNIDESSGPGLVDERSNVSGGVGEEGRSSGEGSRKS
mmetsp:Transcript_17471/g.26936  ORF Transcript_17471/g.26936 Transcript_17471/m.26936 type:complete len:418 (+) Transcript_17471:78-1331(+)